MLMQLYTNKFSKNLWFDRLDYVLSWNTFEEVQRIFVILITRKKQKNKKLCHRRVTYSNEEEKTRQNKKVNGNIETNYSQEIFQITYVQVWLTFMSVGNKITFVTSCYIQRLIWFSVYDPSARPLYLVIALISYRAKTLCCCSTVATCRSISCQKRKRLW